MFLGIHSQCADDSSSSTPSRKKGIKLPFQKCNMQVLCVCVCVCVCVRACACVCVCMCVYTKALTKTVHDTDNMVHHDQDQQGVITLMHTQSST